MTQPVGQFTPLQVFKMMTKFAAGMGVGQSSGCVDGGRSDKAKRQSVDADIPAEEWAFFTDRWGPLQANGEIDIER